MVHKVEDPRVRVFLLYMYVFTLATSLTQGVLAIILRDSLNFQQLVVFLVANLGGFMLLRFEFLTLSTLVYLGTYYILNMHRALEYGLRPEYSVQFIALYTLILCLRLPTPGKVLAGFAIFISALAILVRQSLGLMDIVETNSTQYLASAFMNLAIGFFMVTYTIYCFTMLTDRSERHLRTEANTDGLTGVLNRRAFMAALNQAHYKCSQEDKPLAVILIDVDHFKNVNDTYGHLAGDVVLKRLAEMLQICVRKDDSVGRYGGEEFILLLPNCPLEKAIAIAQRAREMVESTPVPIEHAEPISITVSLGVSKRRTGDSPMHLLSSADEYLYSAKQNGRNRVEHV